MTSMFNKYRTPLHSDGLPDGDLTARQRALADAVQHCRSMADFHAAPRVAVLQVPVAGIPFGMEVETAREWVEAWIARVREELDRMNDQLARYGAAPFCSRDTPVRATFCRSATTRADVITALLTYLNNTEQVLVRAGDSRVREAADGSYIVEGPA